MKTKAVFVRGSAFLLLMLQLSCSSLPSFARKGNPAALINEGDNYFQSGDYAKAAASYSKGIKLDRSSPIGYQKRGNVEFQQQKYKNAIRDLSRAISLSPQDAQSLSLRARAYDNTSEYKKEMRDVESLLSMQPSDGTTLVWHAKLAERFGNTRQVIDDCDKAIQQGLAREQLADLYQLRARAYKKLGKKIESEQELAKFRSLQP